MHDDQVRDNKVRLSRDVLEKAQLIAAEWGLKNARAAVEAVFRRYADEYLGNGTGLPPNGARVMSFSAGRSDGAIAPPQPNRWATPTPSVGMSTSCEALDVLDDLLGA